MNKSRKVRTITIIQAGALALLAIFGVVAGFDDTAPSGDGKVGLSEDAATGLDVTTGDTITIAGTDYTVEKVSGNWWYNHTPVVQMTLDDVVVSQQLGHQRLRQRVELAIVGRRQIEGALDLHARAEARVPLAGAVIGRVALGEASAKPSRRRAARKARMSRACSSAKARIPGSCSR